MEISIIKYAQSAKYLKKICLEKMVTVALLIFAVKLLVWRAPSLINIPYHVRLNYLNIIKNNAIDENFKHQLYRLNIELHWL